MEDWRDKPMLVWQGKIIEKLPTDCEYGDFLCEFGCNEVKPFRLICCEQLFVDKGNKVGDDISIPMGFKDENGKIYNTAVDVTHLSRPSNA